jgi:hemoglobin-like flavoprotein
MDPERLKANFALVAEHGEGLIAYFYADLFRREPELRDLFPASMEKQHRRLLEALAHIVSLVDDPPALVPYLRELGRRHAGHGLTNGHFPQFGVSLLAALAHFTGPGWDEDLERDWAAVYSFVAQIMAEAAAEAAMEQHAVG